MRVLLILFFMTTLIACSNQDIQHYKNANLPVEERVADLLPRMTLEEKVAQLTSTMPMLGFGSDAETSFIDKSGKFVPERAANFLKHGIGQISRPGMSRGPREMAEFTNTVQKWIIENTRMGIPVMFHEEALHGLATTKATSFPQAIALSSTWNTDLVNEVFTATALEVRSRGAQQVLAPVLDIVRDPRWGRTEETYGEDPYLASRMGVAAVTGFQGNSAVIDKSHVIATGKHFAVHGQPENGTNVGPGNYSERIIREQFLKPFEVAVKEGADRIIASMGDITKNYERVVFIKQNIVDSKREEELVRKEAQTKGWRFEKITGDIKLIKGLLSGEWPEEDFLQVEPGQKITIGFGDKIVRVVE